MDSIPENYYQVLRVGKRASVTEIVAAYHAAKGAYSQKRGSSSDGADPYLVRIEEAYSTLADPQRRHHYDQILRLARTLSLANEMRPQSITGRVLRLSRENLNLSYEDVFKITRIPVRYLQAIEDENTHEMPARVYLQGFLKSLAQVYKLDPQETARLFLEYFDKILSQRANS